MYKGGAIGLEVQQTLALIVNLKAKSLPSPSHRR
jgi:hypothetical protein